jgi:hypothetical protein
MLQAVLGDPCWFISITFSHPENVLGDLLMSKQLVFIKVKTCFQLSCQLPYSYQLQNSPHLLSAAESQPCLVMPLNFAQIPSHFKGFLNMGWGLLGLCYINEEDYVSVYDFWWFDNSDANLCCLLGIFNLCNIKISHLLWMYCATLSFA